MTPDELREAVRTKISNAYYDARNKGGTMETAADEAAYAAIKVIREEVCWKPEDLSWALNRCTTPTRWCRPGPRCGSACGARVPQPRHTPRRRP